MAGSLFLSGFPSGFGSAFFQFALERLASFGSYAWNEVKLIWGVEDELRKLQRTMLRVQDMVDRVHCSPSSLMGGSKAWKICSAETKHCSYDADSLVDYIYLHIPTSGSVRPGEVRKKILSYNIKLPHDINVLQNKLEHLEKEIKSLLENEQMKNSSHLMSPLNDCFFSATSLIDESTVVGRAIDKQHCLDLLNEPTEGNFSVISLVGMGGIGKTTLAQLVYGDEAVDQRFQKKIWVSISMNFDVMRITTSIVEALTRNSCTLSDLNSVQVLLQDAIWGRKFLLVLDDYWSEKHDDWDLLSLPLRSGSKGSKVIVTTRSAKVSTTIKSCQTYNLEHLSVDECWDLMKQRIPIEELENLEHIGREIARKCKGLPLAAKTLGSLLSNSEFKANECLCILNCKLWDLPQENNYLFPTLMLSYLHLSPQLQKCFAYCSLFPKDHEFEVEELVLLWMAEGFIQPIDGWRLEDLGHKCFYDLCSKSFFQKITNSTNSSIYKMHGLIHDMAQLVSIDICFQVMNMDMSSSYPLFGDTCHLSMLLDSMTIHLEASQKNERLRTFLMINKSRAMEGQLNMNLFGYLRSLRVLNLSRIGLTELTNSIDSLKCLRYLNLSENQISKLPRSVCNLVALQTLKLKNCEEIRELPEDTKNLSSLRHLDLDIQGQLSQMPPDFGRLTNLQSLSAFIVGNKTETSISQIGDMNLLRGSLCIKDIHRVSDLEHAANAKLHEKSFLDKLELQWAPLPSEASQEQVSQEQDQQFKVLLRLKPHENLKELVINNFCGIFYPPWLFELEHKLTSIHLQGHKYCVRLPRLGPVQSLKSFYISDMPLLESIDDSFYGESDGTVKFPSLESFEVRSMSGLIRWEITGEVVAMPLLLGNFTIQDCPNLTSIPENLRGYPEANISDCPNLLMPPP